MNVFLAVILVAALLAMAAGLAMLYLRSLLHEGVLGDLVRMIDGVDVRAADLQKKVDHLIERGKRGPRKRAATVTAITSNAG